MNSERRVPANFYGPTEFVFEFMAFYLYINMTSNDAKIGITRKHPKTRRPQNGWILEDVALGDKRAVVNCEAWAKSKIHGGSERGPIIFMKRIYDEARGRFDLFRPVIWQNYLKTKPGEKR